jgi:hypothetical protein
MTFYIFARFFTPIKGEAVNKRGSIQTMQLHFDLNSQNQSITLKEVIQKLNINFNDYRFSKGTTFLSLDSTLNNEDYINIFSK